MFSAPLSEKKEKEKTNKQKPLDLTTIRVGGFALELAALVT